MSLLGGNRSRQFLVLFGPVAGATVLLLSLHDLFGLTFGNPAIGQVDQILFTAGAALAALGPFNIFLLSAFNGGRGHTRGRHDLIFTGVVTSVEASGCLVIITPVLGAFFGLTYMVRGAAIIFIGGMLTTSFAVLAQGMGRPRPVVKAGPPVTETAGPAHTVTPLPARTALSSGGTEAASVPTHPGTAGGPQDDHVVEGVTSADLPGIVLVDEREVTDGWEEEGALEELGGPERLVVHIMNGARKRLVDLIRHERSSGNRNEMLLICGCFPHDDGKVRVIDEKGVWHQRNVASGGAHLNITHDDNTDIQDNLRKLNMGGGVIFHTHPGSSRPHFSSVDLGSIEDHYSVSGAKVLWGVTNEQATEFRIRNRGDLALTLTLEFPDGQKTYSCGPGEEIAGRLA